VSGPLPWRALSALLVPFGGLAAGVAVQYWLDGKHPQGDALGRWMLLSTACGLAAGLVASAALARSKRARWAWPAWGIAGPWAVAALALAAGRLEGPVRAAWVARDERACRERGGTLCTPREFAQACARAALPRLGEPTQKLCDDRGCTWRWVYAGAPHPEDLPRAPTRWCSVVNPERVGAPRTALTVVAADAPR
jgi:hypothetical protein